MADYSYYCDFCNEDISFGSCGCDESLAAKKAFLEKAFKDRADRLVRLIAAKRYIIECGFKLNQSSIFDRRKDEVVSDPAEVEEAWIHSDEHHHNIFDTETVAELLRNKK